MLLVSKNIEWHVPRLRWIRIPTDFWESRRVAGHRAWEIRTVGGHRFNTVLTLQALKAGFFLFGLSCFVLPFFFKAKSLKPYKAKFPWVFKQCSKLPKMWMIEGQCTSLPKNKAQFFARFFPSKEGTNKRKQIALWKRLRHLKRTGYFRDSCVFKFLSY